MVNKSREERKKDDGLPDRSDYGPPGDYVVQVKFKPNTQPRLSSDGRLASATGSDLSKVEKVLKKYDTKLQLAFDESRPNRSQAGLFQFRLNGELVSHA